MKHNQKQHWIYLGIIILAAFLAYHNSFTNPFIWDDNKLIKENLAVTHWSKTGQVFAGNVIAESSFYRPLQIISYMADYSIWKFNPAGYHFTSLLLHIGVAIGVYFLSMVLLKSQHAALLAAVLFVIHPIHTEAVTYLAGRADPLFVLFFLAALLAYLTFLNNQRNIYFILAVGLYVLSLLSKEAAIVFPFLLAIYHLVFKVKIDRVKLAVFFGITFVYLILRQFQILGVLDISKTNELTFLQRFPGAFAAIWHYARLLVAPANLNMAYGVRQFSFSHPAFWGGVVILGAVLTGIWANRQKDQVTAFCLLWFFVALLPHLNLYPINAYMAEHWLYLPSIGLFILAGKFLQPFLKVKRIFNAGLVLLVAIGAQLFLTVQQNGIWHDPVRFYEYQIRQNPAFVQAYNNLGGVYLERAEYDQALKYYQSSLDIQPSFIKAYNNMAVVYARQGQEAKAIEYYQKALAVDPDFVPTLNNLGVLYMDSGRFDEAVTYFKRALELDPKLLKAQYNLGLLYDRKKDHAKAIAMLRDSLKVDPNNEQTYNNIGLLQKEQGEIKESIEAFKQAIAINPNYWTAYTNLGSAQAALGKYAEAITNYQKVLAADPSSTSTLNNLGIALYSIGKKDEAITTFLKALAVNPNDPYLLSNFGLLYAQEGNFTKAVEYYKEAIRVDVNYTQAQLNLGLLLSDMELLEEAGEHLRVVIDHEPQNDRALNGLGVIEAKNNNYKAAEEYFVKALIVNKNNREAQANLDRVQKLLADQAS